MTYSLLRSRTFWTIVAMFLVSGGNAISPMIPAGAELFLQAMLSLIAAYFHLQTAQAGDVTN